MSVAVVLIVLVVLVVVVVVVLVVVVVIVVVVGLNVSFVRGKFDDSLLKVLNNFSF